MREGLVRSGSSTFNPTNSSSGRTSDLQNNKHTCRRRRANQQPSTIQHTSPPPTSTNNKPCSSHNEPHHNLHLHADSVRHSMRRYHCHPQIISTSTSFRMRGKSNTTATPTPSWVRGCQQYIPLSIDPCRFSSNWAVH